MLDIRISEQSFIILQPTNLAADLSEMVVISQGNGFAIINSLIGLSQYAGAIGFTIGSSWPNINGQWAVLPVDTEGIAVHFIVDLANDELVLNFARFDGNPSIIRASMSLSGSYKADKSYQFTLEMIPAGVARGNAPNGGVNGRVAWFTSFTTAALDDDLGAYITATILMNDGDRIVAWAQADDTPEGGATFNMTLEASTPGEDIPPLEEGVLEYRALIIG